MASHGHTKAIDPASPLNIGRTGLGAAGSLTIRSTDTVPVLDGLAFWRQSVLQRMDPIVPDDGQRWFRGKMVHIVGTNCDFVDHASDAIHTRRSPDRLKRDGCDDVMIGLVGPTGSTHLSHAGERKLYGNNLCIADFAQPIEHIRSRHRDVTLLFRRQRLQELVKGDLSSLAGRLLPRHGIAALLRSHMRLLATEAEQLSAAERALALEAAGEMAFLALQREFANFPPDEDQFTSGLFTAAHLLIGRCCHDPDLDPAAVARGIGCSRATLYRIFTGRGEPVARAIWTARLELAHRMLSSATQAYLLIDEIAFRAGFTDAAAFSRMFKKRYEMTPREARQQR